MLDIIHSDICEMTDILPRGGKRYFITFIDDASKDVDVFLIRTKDEAFEKFKSYKAKVENFLNVRMKTLRYD